MTLQDPSDKLSAVKGEGGGVPFRADLFQNGGKTVLKRDDTRVLVAKR